MQRTLLIVATVLLVATSCSAKLRKQRVEAPEKVLSAGPSFPVQYTEDSFAEAADPTKDEYVIPVYKPAAFEKPNPSVTEGFCKQMLKDVQEKKAPYWLEGKFTGEARKELLTQCGERICTWGADLAKASESCGSECPKDCSKPTDFVKPLLDDQEALGNFVLSLLKLFPSAADQAAAKQANAKAARFARAQNVDKTYCEGVLAAVKAKEAPWFIPNHETGVPEPTQELRTTLINTCNKKVCGWFEEFKKLQVVSDCPETCNSPALAALGKGKHLVPLLERALEAIKNAPEPELELPADEEDEPAAEPLVIKPSPNDPRDPDYTGGTGATGVEEEEEAEVEEEEEAGPVVAETK